MIPIPKGSSKDLSDILNYRGIALIILQTMIVRGNSSGRFLYQTGYIMYEYHLNKIVW